MTYNGLTIADKPALEYAMEIKLEYAIRNEGGFLWGTSVKPFRSGGEWWTSGGNWQQLPTYEMKFITPQDPEPVHILTALAQIAEMERDFSAVFPDEEPMFGRKPERKPPLTWNERINQMTVEERAKYSAVYAQVVERARRYAYRTRRNRAWEIESVMDRYMRKFLNSPYTKGETK